MHSSQSFSVRPYLTTRNVEPENQESPIYFLQSEIVPYSLFFRRNHFSYPQISNLNYWLPINGSVKRSKVLSLDDIKQLPSKTLKVTLECAGNKRSLFEPKVFGEQWEKGAISQGYWKGVSLQTLLRLTGIQESAKEVVFEAYDYGKRTDMDHKYSYARSLPIEKALHEDTIIAYEYNDKPIPFKHGYPLRLIVPQWYAMASVKWIKKITVIDSRFIGPFQSIDYMYYPNKDNHEDAYPVTTINVNSTIQKPLDMEELSKGKHIIKGIAYTGKGHITNIEVSTDEGTTWLMAQIENQNVTGYEWVTWSYEWEIFDSGEYSIMSRATDSNNRTQSFDPLWNKKGYGYNAIDKIKVKIS